MVRTELRSLLSRDTYKNIHPLFGAQIALEGKIFSVLYFVLIFLHVKLGMDEMISSVCKFVRGNSVRENEGALLIAMTTYFWHFWNDRMFFLPPTLKLARMSNNIATHLAPATTTIQLHPCYEEREIT